MLADIRHGARAIWARPGFAAVVMLTLAFGIGVNVAIFSLAEHVLLRPLPVPEPNRLVSLADPGPKTVGRMDPVLPQLASTSSPSGGSETLFSYPMFRDLERAQEPFVGLAAHRFFQASLFTGEGARQATGALVSGSYFSVLGLQPALGRLLGPADDSVDGVAESVVLSHSYWQGELGGDPNVIGRTLHVNEIPLTIVGVAPRGFHGTHALPGSPARASVFVPITISFSTGLSELAAALAVPNHDRRGFYWVHLFARLQPGVTSEAAAASLNTLYRAILTEVEAPQLLEVDEQQREAFRTRSLVLETGARGQTSAQALLSARYGVGLLLAVSGLILLLCCANVAGLILLRATARSGEMAVRASMGATRGRLASLLLAESLVLALPAALMSLPIASFVLRGASRVPGVPEAVSGLLEAVSDVRLTAAAALVAIGVAVASAVIVGLLPVRALIRTEPGRTLQASGARHTTAKGVARFRAALATSQVALSMALLAMTGVFAQSLVNITRLDLGLDFDAVVMVSVSLPSGQSDPVRARIAEALEAIPGTSAVASSYPPLLSPEGALAFVAAVEGVEAERPVRHGHVSPDFFRMFGIELLAGREFNDTDSGASVAIVSERLAERFGLARDSILGRTIELAGNTPEIIGVVADVRSGRITDDIVPRMFLPGGGDTFYVRGTRPPEELMNAIRETVRRVDPTMPITRLRTMEQQFRENTGTERFFAGVSTAFAVLATVLAAIGLYGMLAYSVAQRSREIGLRFALGAPASRIRGMVLRQLAGMAVTGLVIGAVAAWWVGRAARSLLFGVEPGDPIALAAAAALLTVVTLGAAYLPARRASRVDLMTVLRYE